MILIPNSLAQFSGDKYRELIFFPIAPYILTDFQHLQFPGTDGPVWFDVLLIWFAFTGWLLDIVSSFLMQEIFRREFGRAPGWFAHLLLERRLDRPLRA